jgi:hypothetical protein
MNNSSFPPKPGDLLVRDDLYSDDGDESLYLILEVDFPRGDGLFAFVNMLDPDGKAFWASINVKYWRKIEL